MNNTEMLNKIVELECELDPEQNARLVRLYYIVQDENDYASILDRLIALTESLNK